MARRLILDTGVLIVAERSRESLGSVLSADDDVVIAAVTAAELFAGIELADDRFRERRTAFVNRALDLIPVVPYDLSIASTWTATGALPPNRPAKRCALREVALLLDG